MSEALDGRRVRSHERRLAGVIHMKAVSTILFRRKQWINRRENFGYELLDELGCVRDVQYGRVIAMHR